MGSITIRNLDDAIKRSAKLEAARNGRSLEAEIRALLEKTYLPSKSSRAKEIRELAGDSWIHELIKIADGADLQLPERVSKTNDPFDVD